VSAAQAAGTMECEEGVAAQSQKHSADKNERQTGLCQQFVANAAVAEDQFVWHVDADPADVPADSNWVTQYGLYTNRVRSAFSSSSHLLACPDVSRQEFFLRIQREFPALSSAPHAFVIDCVLKGKPHDVCS
jgi:hypothetical protein